MCTASTLCDCTTPNSAHAARMVLTAMKCKLQHAASTASHHVCLLSSSLSTGNCQTHMLQLIAHAHRLPSTPPLKTQAQADLTAQPSSA